MLQPGVWKTDFGRSVSDRVSQTYAALTDGDVGGFLVEKGTPGFEAKTIVAS
jgi:hypothetical protein